MEREEGKEKERGGEGRRGGGRRDVQIIKVSHTFKRHAPQMQTVKSILDPKRKVKLILATAQMGLLAA